MAGGRVGGKEGGRLQVGERGSSKEQPKKNKQTTPTCRWSTFSAAAVAADAEGRGWRASRNKEITKYGGKNIKDCKKCKKKITE